MVSPNWQILQPVDVGAKIQEGLALGEKQREKREVRNALAQYAAAPSDAAPINALMRYAPEMAIRLRDEQRKEQTYQDGQKFNQAVAGYYGAPQGSQAAPSSMQSPQDEPAKLSPRDQAFHKMMAIDPVRAMKIDSDARNLVVEKLKGLDDVYDLAISRLGGATDENSYQVMLNELGERFKPYGYDVRSIAPANYPGPEGIRSLLQTTLDAKEQLAALDRRERQQWDREDDTIDNTRADREASSRIESRNRGAANAERRTQIAANRPNNSRSAKAPKVTATNPETGETITLNSRGQWVDKNGKPVQ